jgi:hypothetical protein
MVVENDKIFKILYFFSFSSLITPLSPPPYPHTPLLVGLFAPLHATPPCPASTMVARLNWAYIVFDPYWPPPFFPFLEDRGVGSRER